MAVRKTSSGACLVADPSEVMVKERRKREMELGVKGIDWQLTVEEGFGGGSELVRWPV